MHRARRSRVLALALLVATGALAGCAARGERADPELVEMLAGTRAMDWNSGNFWAYTATFHEDLVIDVALIVHSVSDHGFHLGSNASAGFFGLPFTGNVTPSLNPRIGPDEWPLYRFPLEDGKSWTYSMFGYSATTVARAALIDVPGLGPTPGYTFESASYGQVFARYDYTSVTGWFTRLELIEPTDGHHVLDVQLTAYGPDYGQAYYVEEPIRTLTVPCTELPGTTGIDIPEGHLRIHVLLLAESRAGLVQSRLLDTEGKVVATAKALGTGSEMDRASVGESPGHWQLEHTCAGLGSIYLEITGLAANGPLAQSEGRASALPDLALPKLPLG